MKYSKLRFSVEVCILPGWVGIVLLNEPSLTLIEVCRLLPFVCFGFVSVQDSNSFHEEVFDVLE